jgi:hypothetical protein
MYKCINRCNVLIDAFDNNEEFMALDKTTPSPLGHLYAEVVSIRATIYYELTRAWGDIVYFTSPILGREDYAGVSVTDRSDIQDSEIDKLIEVEPMMYQLHEAAGGLNTTVERMSKEYVQGLIARLALIRGGYALRPADYSGDGDVIQSHSEWGKMVRRSDYLDYYQIANTYLQKVVNEGNASLVTSDPRNPAEKFSNPFQYHFQRGMDYQFSNESIYEISQKSGDGTERPYAFGRPSDGGKTGYPGKAYGQLRFFPTYYFGMFHPKDLRRDVTVATTALGGKANEKMIRLKKGNKSNGGLSLNKWDYCRMVDKTYAVKRRETGINAPYMRMGDMILLLAETYAVLGQDGAAQTELLRIRERAFDPNDVDYSANTAGYVGGLGGDALMEAIQTERALELGGEGARRYDLVRWGILGKKVNEIQAQMDAMINGLQSSGSYTFANGNTISSYIYTKIVKKEDSGLDDILTTSCYVDEDDPLYPLLYPAWRGTATDDWNASSSAKLAKEIIAIKGMFKPLTAAEIAAAEADGYEETVYGADMLEETEAWTANIDGVFGGYLPSDYAANHAPRYILAMPISAIIYSEGNVQNKYGFPNQ